MFLNKRRKLGSGKGRKNEKKRNNWMRLKMALAQVIGISVRLKD